MGRNITAIILAAGIGSRMKSITTKQLMHINGESLIKHTARAFFASEYIDEVIVAVRDSETDVIEREISSIAVKPYKIIIGGRTRAESARLAFMNVGCSEYVAIHDCARCLITSEMIERVADAAFETGAASAICRIHDTVKRIENDVIVATLPRNNIVKAQTPQIFKTELYERALSQFDVSDSEITDDNMMVEKLGAAIKCVDLGEENLKITTPADIAFAEQILLKRGNENV